MRILSRAQERGGPSQKHSGQTGMRRYGGNWEVQMWTKIAAMVGSVLLIAFAAVGQDSSVPEIKFRAVADFLKMPADMYFGEVAGVATDSKGDVYVFSRGNTTGPAFAAPAATLRRFGRDGKFMREIGPTLSARSSPHSGRSE